MSTDILSIESKYSVQQELQEITPLVSFRGLSVYVLQGNNFPETMRLIGRIRELIFSKHGAGRGELYDLDKLDFGEQAYYQLIAYDDEEQELVAAYRFQWGQVALSAGDQYLRTSTLFDYSDQFRDEILPYAIELGRSVVNDSAKRARFGFFAIWKGFSQLIQNHANLQYFFGNVTLYKTMNPFAKDILINYLEHNYKPSSPKLVGKKDVVYKPRLTSASDAVDYGEIDTPANRIQKLRSILKPYDASVPTIIQTYMATGLRIWFGETVFDNDFGNAHEIGIIIPISSIDDSFRKRFL
ncbi:MAG: GNAT family N-acetyltransferase [Cyclonatronaceae bacterium]